MEKNTPNRTVTFTFRMTPDEKKLLAKKWKNTTCRKLGDYVRRVLLEQTVVTQTRDKSMDDFMEHMILLRNELIRVGNNYNQVVVKLHTMKSFSEIKGWLTMHEVTEKMLMHQLQTIKSFIEINGIKWLR